MRARLFIFLLFISATLAFSQQAEDWYMGKPIRDIKFEGLRNVKSSELTGVVEPFIGRIFDDALFWELQGKLYGLEYFDLISPSTIPADAEGSSIILKFVVTEKPVVSRVRFEGNKGLRQNELLDVVSIKPGDVSNSLKLRMDEQALVGKYLERGFPDVKVVAESRKDDASSLSIVFVIDEGDQTAIEAFRFEGISAVSEKTLRGLLSLKTKSLLDPGAFQEAKLLADKDALVSYYRERGYVDASITDIVRESRKDDQGRNLLTLTFKIKEGRQYTFEGISFEGNIIFTTEKLASLVSLKPGQTLNFKRLEGDFQRVADLYYENGYIFNSINRKETRNEDSASIRYVISIVERGRAYIENIIIKGNTKTKESVILREIPLQSGDIFSKTKVVEGLRNLYNLQFFSAVSPDTPMGSADNLMDLVFNVEEQPTADIQFGVTFSGQSTPDSFPVSALVKWNDRNFLGRGQTFGIELNAAPDTQKLAFQFTERWLLGSPLSGSFDFTIAHSQRKTAQDIFFPLFNGDESEAFPDPYLTYEEYVDASYAVPDAYMMSYEQWNYSLGFSSGYRFSTPVGLLNTGGGVRSGIINNTYDEIKYRPFDPILREGNNNWQLSQSVFAIVSLDNRDLAYDPSAGYFASQRLAWVGVLPFEKEHYIRTDSKAEVFFTLVNTPVTEVFNLKAVFGIHSGISFLLPQFSSLPVIESANMLAIDGMFTARGWWSERTNYGKALWENWAEIRIPVAPGILALDWFLDAAAVKETPELMLSALGVDDFRFSLGAGFRFAIPQFPFRFSLAKRFKFVDGNLTWMPGSLWRDADKADSGLDFVISFVLPSY